MIERPVVHESQTLRDKRRIRPDKDRNMGAKDRVPTRAQYIMKNKARNAFPSHGTNEISGMTCYGIIRNEEIFSHNVKDEKSRSAMHRAPTFFI